MFFSKFKFICKCISTLLLVNKFRFRRALAPLLALLQVRKVVSLMLKLLRLTLDLLSCCYRTIMLSYCFFHVLASWDILVFSSWTVYVSLFPMGEEVPWGSSCACHSSSNIFIVSRWIYLIEIVLFTPGLNNGCHYLNKNLGVTHNFFI